MYFFYGDNDVVLYMGKSINMRSRVMSHFSGDHRVNKDMQIAQQIKRIDWKQTAGELGALLLESRLVKQLAPVHNRQLRRNTQLCAWHWRDDRHRHARRDWPPPQILIPHASANCTGCFVRAPPPSRRCAKSLQRMGYAIFFWGWKNVSRDRRLFRPSDQALPRRVCWPGVARAARGAFERSAQFHAHAAVAF